MLIGVCSAGGHCLVNALRLAIQIREMKNGSWGTLEDMGMLCGSRMSAAVGTIRFNGLLTINRQCIFVPNTIHLRTKTPIL